MPQRFRTSLANAGVAVTGRNDVLLAARLDARQGQFLAQDGGQLFQGQLNFQDVSARLIAGAGLIVALDRTERRAHVAVALADAARSLVAVAKLGYLYLRQRDADEVFPLLADHFAAADVLAQVAFHLAADDLAEALVIAFDFLAHFRAPQFNLGHYKAATNSSTVNPAERMRLRKVPFASNSHGELHAVISYFFVCPRAKILATKLSTSVAHTSQ